MIKKIKQGIIGILITSMPFLASLTVEGQESTKIVETIDRDVITTLNWKNQYLVKATSSDPERGNVTSPNDYVDEDNFVTFTANANPGYFFDSWVGGDFLNNNCHIPRLDIKVSKPITNLYAVFIRLPEFAGIKRDKTQIDLKLNIEPTLSSRNYFLLSTTNLFEGIWTTNYPPISETGSNVMYSVTNNAPSMFFRVKAEENKE